MPDFPFHASAPESFELLQLLVERHGIERRSLPPDPAALTALRTVSFEVPGCDAPFQFRAALEAAGIILIGWLAYDDERMSPEADAVFDELVETLREALVHKPDLAHGGAWVGRETLAKVEAKSVGLRFAPANRWSVGEAERGVARPSRAATEFTARPWLPRHGDPANERWSALAVIEDQCERNVSGEAATVDLTLLTELSAELDATPDGGELRERLRKLEVDVGSAVRAGTSHARVGRLADLANRQAAIFSARLVVLFGVMRADLAERIASELERIHRLMSEIPGAIEANRKNLGIVACNIAIYREYAGWARDFQAHATAARRWELLESVADRIHRDYTQRVSERPPSVVDLAALGALIDRADDARRGMESLPIDPPGAEMLACVRAWQTRWIREHRAAAALRPPVPTGAAALEATPWASVEHARGPAADTRKHLSALFTGDVYVLLEHLYDCVLHQDTPAPATEPTARVIAGYIGDPRADKGDAPLRPHLLSFLGHVVSSVHVCGMDLDTLRRTVDRSAPQPDPEVDPDAAFERSVLECADLLPLYLPAAAQCLGSPQRATRIGAATSIAATSPMFTPEEKAFFEAAILDRIEAAADASERAALLIAWGKFGSTGGAAALYANEDADPGVRFAAALAPARAKDPTAARVIAQLLQAHAPTFNDIFGSMPPEFHSNSPPRRAAVSCLVASPLLFDEYVDAAIAVTRIADGTNHYPRAVTNACPVYEWIPFVGRAFSAGDGEVKTEAQRRFLTALVDNERVWTIPKEKRPPSPTSTEGIFRKAGLEYEREACRARLK